MHVYTEARILFKRLIPLTCDFPYADRDREQGNMESSSTVIMEPEVDDELRNYPVPDAYLCPISKLIMKDPVLGSDYHTYERSQICQWIADGNVTSPVTRETLVVPVEPLSFPPNIALRKAIAEFLEGNRNNGETKGEAYSAGLAGELATKRMQLMMCEKGKRDLLTILDSVEHAGALPPMDTQGRALCPVDYASRLTDLLRDWEEDGKMRNSILKAISWITSSQEEGLHQVNRRNFGEAGACEMIAIIAGNCLQEPETTKAAILVLGQLALEASNRERLELAESLYNVFKGMCRHPSNLSIQQVGLQAIVNLADEQRNKMACQRVMQAMADYDSDPDVVYHGCKAIGRLAAVQQNQVDLGEDAGKVVYKAMALFSSNPKILTEACIALVKLADGEPLVVKKLCRLGVVTVLEGILLPRTDLAPSDEDLLLEKEGLRALALFVQRDRLDEVKKLRGARRIRDMISAGSILGDMEEGLKETDDVLEKSKKGDQQSSACHPAIPELRESPTQECMPVDNDDETLKVSMQKTLTPASDLLFGRQRSDELGSDSEGAEESCQVTMDAAPGEIKESETGLGMGSQRSNASGDGACAQAPAEVINKEDEDGDDVRNTSWGTDMTGEELAVLVDDEITINRPISDASLSGLVSSSEPQVELAEGNTVLAAEPGTANVEVDESFIESSRSCFPFRCFSMPSFSCWKKKTAGKTKGGGVPVYMATSAAMDAEAGTMNLQEEPKRSLRFRISNVLRWGSAKRKAKSSAKQGSPG